MAKSMDRKLIAKTQPHEPASVLRMLRTKNPGVEIDKIRVGFILKKTRSADIARGVFHYGLGYEVSRFKLTAAQKRKVLAIIAEFAAKDKKFIHE